MGGLKGVTNILCVKSYLYILLHPSVTHALSEQPGKPTGSVHCNDLLLIIDTATIVLVDVLIAPKYTTLLRDFVRCKPPHWEDVFESLCIVAPSTFAGNMLDTAG